MLMVSRPTHQRSCGLPRVLVGRSFLKTIGAVAFVVLILFLLLLLLFVLQVNVLMVIIM
jgi:hypothetical protein